MDGTDVDDPPALPLRDQAAGGLLAAQERPVQIRADHPFPRREWCLGDPPATDPRIVDKDVNAPERVVQFGEQARDRVRLANVYAAGERAATIGADEPGGLCRARSRCSRR